MCPSRVKGRTRLGLHVVLAQPDKIEKGIGRVIKGQHVIGQIHMAVIVDPIWMHALTVQLKRRGDIGQSDDG